MNAKSGVKGKSHEFLMERPETVLFFSLKPCESVLRKRLFYGTLLHINTIYIFFCLMKGFRAMTERNMVNMTITMTKEERRALKQIALDNDISVSALIREWLREHLENIAKKDDYSESR